MKKQNIKIFSIILSSALFAGAVCGCAGKPETETVEETDTGAAEITADVSAGDNSSEVIDIVKNADYAFAPEEIMFISGVRYLAEHPGTSYTLKDLDGDMVSELFIRDGDAVSAYAYDETADLAVKSDKFDSEIEAVTGDESTIWIDSSQWADGDIYGVAGQMEDPGVKNDFYISTNYENLQNASVSYQGDCISFAFRGNSISEDMKKMFRDRDSYKGDDIERVRTYYDIATNWDKREEEGVTPVKKYLDAIENIGSISALSDYLADPSKDPFSIFFTFRTTLDLTDTSHWIATVQGDNFSILPRIYNNSEESELEELRGEYDAVVREILERSGYSSADADRILSECYEIENTLLEACWPSEDDDENDELLTPMPLAEIDAKCENFPIGRILGAYGVKQGCINADYPRYIRTLDSLYTEENLSKLKSYCIVHTAYEAGSYLDLETKNAYYTKTGMEGYSKEDLNDLYEGELLSGRGIMGVAIENAYMTYFVDDEERDDITKIANDIKDTFREIIESQEWMSEEGKKACTEKLDKMEFNILKPDAFIDSSYLGVDPELNYLDAYAALTVNTRKHMGGLVGSERIRGDWRYDIQTEVTTTVDNCFYYGAFNQFFILDGFINDYTYRLDMSYEEKLGRLGEVIGHELTHGFDPNGIQYDKDGNMVVSEENPFGWMPEEDYKAYTERAQRLSDYFSTFTPYPYNRCDGNIYRGEAAADIAGMRIGLKMASNYEGFDYDLYFRSHSQLWAKQATLIVEQGDIFNEHPLNYLRINATCQQFPEFYETYGISEGDGMYLAEEDRISIW